MDDPEELPLIGYTDKCSWPFRQHPVYQRLYAPWGAFGGQYRIASLEEYQVINGGVNLSFMLALLCANAAFSLGKHWGLWFERGGIFVAPLIIIGLLHSFHPSAYPCRASVTISGGSCNHGPCGGYSLALDRQNLLCIGLAFLGVFPRSPHHEFISWLFMAIDLLFATAFSAMIVAHGTKVDIETRQWPTR